MGSEAVGFPDAAEPWWSLIHLWAAWFPTQILTTPVGSLAQGL